MRVPLSSDVDPETPSTSRAVAGQTEAPQSGGQAEASTEANGSTTSTGPVFLYHGCAECLEKLKVAFLEEIKILVLRVSSVQACLWSSARVKTPSLESAGSSPRAA